MTDTVTDDELAVEEPGSAIEAGALAQLFTDAHTYSTWRDDNVPLSLLSELYELVRWAPTAMNANPARFVFVCSDEAKGRLRPHLSEKNVKQTMSAPCCVIVAEDVEFWRYMDRLVPARPNVRERLRDNPDAAREQSRLNTTMQSAYLILAARALGLDTGPMQGFDRAGVDVEFFADGTWKSSLLINLGYGAENGHRPRNPRLDFAEACRVL
jgi:3-hydroxypropanoate dehydrogenase